MVEINPRVLTFHPDNSVRDRMFYDGWINDDGTKSFAIRQASPGDNASGVGS